MYQRIHETCAVAGIFNHATFVPKKFLWQNRQYKINTITFIANVTDGAVKTRVYSVQVGPNMYRLLFNRTEETWYVEEVWCE